MVVMFVLLLCTIFLVFGLLAAAGISAVSRALWPRAKLVGFRDMMRGGALAIVVGIAVYFLLAKLDVDFHDHFLHDFLWNGAAFSSLAALAGVMMAIRHARN